MAYEARGYLCNTVKKNIKLLRNSESIQEELKVDNVYLAVIVTMSVRS